MSSAGSPRRPVLATCLAAAVGLIVGAGVPAPLEGQTVLGTAIDGTDGSPVAGAFVLLVDEDGAERDRSLTTASGTFRLEGPPGTYRLNLERIGFEDLVTEPFELSANETISRRLRASARPIALAGIRVTGGEARCGIPTEEAMELSRVWDEARKALEATAWTDRQSYYRFDVLIVRQELDADGQPASLPQYEPIRIYGRHPFRSVQPTDLALGGWVQRQGGGLKFFAPDAEVLLSASFLGRHCFRLVKSDSAAGQLVGVEFEPLPESRVPDIAGVLWVDRRTAELKELEYGYANLNLPVETERVGGRVLFEHLPDGGWIVRSWEIRTPLAELQQTRRGNRSQQRVRLSGLRLEGQQVVAVWRTGDVQAAPDARLPADVPPVTPPPDELIARYPPPEDLARSTVQ